VSPDHSSDPNQRAMASSPVPAAVQQLPAELRTPPLPLVALLCHPEVHGAMGVWASQVLRPPLVAIAAAEPNEAVLARLFGKRHHAEERMAPQQPAHRTAGAPQRPGL
jgi:hypothetical protein